MDCMIEYILNVIYFQIIKRVMDTKCISFLFAMIVAAVLSSCAGTWTSSRPIYPESWPALGSLDTGRVCPDISGKYLAVSDEAGPLVYPPGGHPRDMFMFVTYGSPKPIPALGRRILPWHLAGEFDQKSDVWAALSRYSALLDDYPANSNRKDNAVWVQVQELQGGLIEVRAGLHDQALLQLELRNEAQGIWTYRSHRYECEDGGLVVYGAFPPPLVENPYGRLSAIIGAIFTFYRTADGSLVALEQAYTGVGGGNMVFKKWWIWRRIE